MRRLLSFSVLVVMMILMTTNVLASDDVPLGLQEVTGYGDYLTGPDADGDYDGYPRDKPASGVQYQLGQCAVHPMEEGGDEPILEYGTIVYIDINQSSPYGDPLPLPNNTWRNSFVVQDMGDKNYALHPLCDYWIDVYCGRWNEFGSKFDNEDEFVQWINENYDDLSRYLFIYL